MMNIVGAFRFNSTLALNYVVELRAASNKCGVAQTTFPFCRCAQRYRIYVQRLCRNDGVHVSPLNCDIKNHSTEHLNL